MIQFISPREVTRPSGRVAWSDTALVPSREGSCRRSRSAGSPGHPQASRRRWGLSFHFVEQGQRLLNQNLPRSLAQGGATDVIVSAESSPVLLGQDVTKGVIGQTEQKIVATPHLALEIGADIGQRLARDREDVGLTQADQIQASGDTSVGIGLISHRGAFENSSKGWGFHREMNEARGACESRLL